VIVALFFDRSVGRKSYRLPRAATLANFADRLDAIVFAVFTDKVSSNVTIRSIVRALGDCLPALHNKRVSNQRFVASK
jgi:hypothetical protein